MPKDTAVSNAVSVSSRAQQNHKRKEALSAKSNGLAAGDRPLSKVTFKTIEFEPCYELVYKGSKEKEIITLKIALQVLPLPVLFFLGVKNGRSVCNKKSMSLGLSYQGDDSSCKGWGITNNGSHLREDWVPTHVRRRENGIYSARDYRTDGPDEWHSDVLLWSLSGLNEDGFMAAIEGHSLGQFSLLSDAKRLHGMINWLEKVDMQCTEKVGFSISIENGVGSRMLDFARPPPSGFFNPSIAMPFYSPVSGCANAATAALIKHTGGDGDCAERIMKCNRVFATLTCIQTFLQQEQKLRWSCDTVSGAERMTPEALLSCLMSMKGQKRLFLVRLIAHNSLSKHVVAVDAGAGIIWDSCERKALFFTKENFSYCCGKGKTLRGLQELRELKKQLAKKRRSRGEANTGRKRARKCFK